MAQDLQAQKDSRAAITKWVAIIKADNLSKSRVKGSSNNTFSQPIKLLSEMPMLPRVLELPPPE